MPVWTDEQLNAINAHSHPVIVSAAAGSGKTAVLVERTIRLLCDENLKIPADRLLAVTFTNDAASQMKEKLSQALEAMAEACPESSWIQSQQSLIRLADICTINSFCFDLVKNNLDSTGFQSGVRIMEDNEASMVTERALTSVLENAYREREAEIDGLILKFCKENDSELKSIILKLYGLLRSLPFRKRWTEKTVSSLSDGSCLKKIIDYYSNKASEYAKNLIAIAEKLKISAESLEYHSSAKEVFLSNCEYALYLASLPGTKPWDELYGVFSDIEFKSLKGIRQKKSESESTSHSEILNYDAAKSCLESLKEAAGELASCYGYTTAQMRSDQKEVTDSFLSILRLTDELFDEVEKIKTEKNALDFADTELITVRLLVNCLPDGRLERTPLAEEIRQSQRYRLILIDEFQDVNNLQEVIFKAISDTDDLGTIGCNVFAVGDVKQAIYRFRQANPMIFMNTRLQGRSDESPVEEILLSRNFRSRKCVLDFSNYVFSSLMTEKMGEVDYTESEELVYGASYEGEDAPCEIISVNSRDDGENEVVTDEFHAAARRIRQMIDQKVTVRDENGVRPCRPGDFCVLTRNNVFGDDIINCFADEGLKIQSGGVMGYLKSREISLIVNILSVTVSPMRDIALSAVMLSPVMGFTDDELALVKMRSRKDRLYKNMLEISLSAEDGDLKKKCLRSVALIKRLQLYSSGLPLTRLIKKIYDETDLLAMAASYEDGAKKCANLYLMLDYAKSYEQSSKDGLAGFLRYIEYISKNGGDFAEALTVFESDDAVNLKTIHKSKGLEYPFVFLCQLSKKINKKDLQGGFLLNADSGVGMSFYDYSSLTKRSTVFYDYVRSENMSQMLSEELRLLYVAATRAKERLFVVLNLEPSAVERAAKFSYSINSHIVPLSVSGRAVSMQDWLIMAFIKHPGFSAIRDLLPFEPYTDTGFLPKISFCGAPPSSGSRQENADKAEADADPELVDKILRSFEYKSGERLTSEEAKISVSELVGEDPTGFFPEVPMLSDTVTELSAAQKGTLMHRFMQYADYHSAYENLEGEIQRLKSAGTFSQSEADSLNRRALGAFFGGELYKRMSKSDNVMREKSFIVKFEDINTGKELSGLYSDTESMLQGIADCLFEESDGYVLVDYKTDRVKSADELRARYSLQLALYKAAFDVILDKPVKKSYIYSLTLSEAIEADV